MESMCHNVSSFVTLTYEDAPKGQFGLELRPRDTQLFMKRLRKNLGFPIRYFLVGEYGDQTQRPHYHAALFGVDPGFEAHIHKAWGHGFIHVGLVEQNSASYLAGYTTKKMTSADDDRLDGRHPEFARMSTSPAIGAPFVPRLAHWFTATSTGAKTLQELGDVPPAVRIGGKVFPLGRTLRGKLREEVGWFSSNMPAEKREFDIKVREAWTPDIHALHERKRLGGLRIAQTRQKLANQRKVL